MTIMTDAGVTVRWRGGYGRLWSAAVLSRFGDAVRNVAFPLVAAGLTTSPFLLSVVSAAGYLPWLLFGLLGGALADRVDRRRAMWTVDVVRGVLVAAFALALALGQAHLAVLAVLAFALTTLQTLFDNAATAILPTLVPRAALPSANARLMTGQALAGTFLGAPAAGLLVTAGVALPFAVDAATYLVAAALIASLPRPAVGVSVRPAGSTLRSEIAAGVRRLWRDRLLRGGCLANLLGNLVIGGLQALLVLIITRWAGASDVVFGLVLAAYGAGGVVGGLVATRVGRWVGGGAAAMVLALAAQAGCLLVIGGVPHPAATAAALAVFGVAGMVVNVHFVSLTQQRTPDDLLGRVSSAERTLGAAGAPVGALLFGALAEVTEVNVPALAGAAFLAVSALVVRRAARTERLDDETVNRGV
ncbi:MFS transporter [Jiangella alba]|uniref:Predicted arabinose efflux permease, MFS family n=1 Tax=Jiangella alba TaxID=561176 RepID=A0A1H5PUN8_9ACTN|nr:MFS transporter [Jiangella alba]SEF16921.1 Predicted arabinose efflux permease, MFS family [Jiangella alba]